MYVVHWNYGNGVHLVRCPDGSGKLFKYEQLMSFLMFKQWRYAK
jgi:hypothetical protein